MPRRHASPEQTGSYSEQDWRSFLPSLFVAMSGLDRQARRRIHATQGSADATIRSIDRVLNANGRDYIAPPPDRHPAQREEGDIDTLPEPVTKKLGASALTAAPDMLSADTTEVQAA